MDCTIAYDIIVRHRAAVFELLPCKQQSLLTDGDTFSLIYCRFEVINRAFVGYSHVQRLSEGALVRIFACIHSGLVSVPGQSPHEDVHVAVIGICVDERGRGGFAEIFQTYVVCGLRTEIVG